MSLNTYGNKDVGEDTTHQLLIFAGFTPLFFQTHASSQPTPARKTQVTLTELLNTLDGPGSKEGHIVILTTNAPNSLDKAIYRPGRIELRFFWDTVPKLLLA
jgi:SpoVK/Ycf46/Vps4 family AAA+-type ATPase